MATIPTTKKRLPVYAQSLPAPHTRSFARVTAVKRLAAAALAVFFAAAAVHSTAFIFAHAGHKHAHGDYDDACAVCAHLASAGSLMNSFSPPAADTPRAAVFFEQSDTEPNFINSYNDAATPIQLKVRLNN